MSFLKFLFPRARSSRFFRRDRGTFQDAHYPRPVSGCDAEGSQCIAGAVFAALIWAPCYMVTAAPAGTDGNFGLVEDDPEDDRDCVLDQISWGCCGGNSDRDGLSNGCSAIGISKAAPVLITNRIFQSCTATKPCAKAPAGLVNVAADSVSTAKSSFWGALSGPVS